MGSINPSGNNRQELAKKYYDSAIMIILYRNQPGTHGNKSRHRNFGTVVKTLVP